LEGRVQNNLRIFISHSSQDEPFARIVNAAFQAQGVNTFLAEHDISIGDVILQKMLESIDQVTHLVYVISSASLEPELADERLNAVKMYAEERGITILPMLIELVELPSTIQSIKFADFSDWKRPEKFRSTFMEVLRAIGVKPKLSGSMELHWYCRSQSTIRKAANFISAAYHELSGALDAHQANSEQSEQMVFYTTVKYIFEEPDPGYFVSSLRGLHKTINSIEANDSTARLGLLKNEIEAIILFVSQEFSNRVDYAEHNKVCRLYALLGNIYRLMDQIYSDLELIAFSAIQVSDKSFDN
jgi:hypothetical protein